MKKFISILLTFLFFLAFSFSAESSWVLGAEQFRFNQAKRNSQFSPSSVDSEISKLLPQLILEQIAQRASRQIPASEELNRKLDSLQTDRISLLLQLSKEYKTRDALVLQNLSARKFKSALEDESEKISEIEKKIDENLALAEAERVKAAPDLEREEKIAAGEKIEERPGEKFHFFPFFGRPDEKRQPLIEEISIYKNDSSAVFMPTEEALAAGYESRLFEKEISAAKINGFLSGVITVFGEYASVSVSLYVYPGAKKYGSVTEVGLLGQPLVIARNIARAMTPILANSLPVELNFEILPKEAARTARITVDGLVFDRIPDHFPIDAGIHTILVESSGYEKASISYQFRGNDHYLVKADLPPLAKGSFDLRLKKMKDGIFYADGIEMAPVTEEKPSARLSINGKSVLGYFSLPAAENLSDSDEEKKPDGAFFYIPNDKIKNGGHLLVNAKTFDRAANIDKRRRSMYTAYSALICSLPFTFYTYGNFLVENQGLSLGYKSYADVKEWQKKSYVCLGITSVLGVISTIELIRYLYAANQVLPASGKTDKKWQQYQNSDEAKKSADSEIAQ